MRFSFVPTIRSILAIGRGNPSKAVDLLGPARVTNLAGWAAARLVLSVRYIRSMPAGKLISHRIAVRRRRGNSKRFSITEALLVQIPSEYWHIGEGVRRWQWQTKIWKRRPSMNDSYRSGVKRMHKCRYWRV